MSEACFMSEKLLIQGQHYYTWSQSTSFGASIHVSPSSQFLCAALSTLACTCYTSLGGSQHLDLVSQTATQLALLTKIDDDVIDSLPFHQGHHVARDHIIQQTRSYLAPTLSSIHTASAFYQDDRCQLAAALGQNLRTLSSNSKRLRHILSWIDQGWEIQAQAVAILTAHPSLYTLQQVKHISAQISGVWLLMITLVGTLPADATRTLTLEEENAFFTWGEAIQIADALADFKKDLYDKHMCTVPGRLLFQHHGDAYIEWIDHNSLSMLYQSLVTNQVDLACLPAVDFYQSASIPLHNLKETAYLLQWIHGFLTWRYIHAMESQRASDDEKFAPFIQDLSADFTHYVQGIHNLL